MAKKYYAVAKGRTPGIYFTWEACRAQIDRFPGAVYKGFPTIAEAEEFICKAGESVSVDTRSTDRMEQADRQGGRVVRQGIDTMQQTASIEPHVTGEESTSDSVSTDQHLIAYVDGSYEHSQGRYAYGCALVLKDKVVTLNGSGAEPDYVAMRNVAGEILGSEQAVLWALEHGYTAVTIFYDYEGIEKWANGLWRANKPGTKKYQTFIAQMRREIDISFQKVAAHTGVTYNEMADRLAKEALGLV